jgi:hypothetical protein
MTFSACRSNWICASVLFALSAAASSVAQDSALRVRPADRELIASEPRQVVATTFTLTNDSRTPMEVESRVELPEHWQPVTPPLPFTLAPGETALKLVSFTIPEDTRGGDYTVRYEARDRQQPAISDSYSLQVRVTALTRLHVVVLDLPDFAISGEVVDGAVLLRNAGNARVAVNFKVDGRFISGVTPKQGQVLLEPGETRRVELAIAVRNVRERKAGRITFIATAEDASVNAVTSGAIQIVPRASAFDALRTLDSRLETRFVARAAAAGLSSGFQPSISGAGILHEDRNDLLRFHFRGPDRRASGSFGAAEEYWVRYENERFATGAGDLNYGLTPLLEPGRLGRGAFLGFQGDRWGASAYGMRDTFGTGDADQFGAGSHLRITPDTKLGLNFLSRNAADGRGGIWSLRAHSAGTDSLNLDLELGQSIDGGTRGGALRFALRDDRYAVRYYALGWSADTQFLGPLRDKLYLSTGFDYPNPKGWGLRGYYRMQDWNLTPLEEIDPDLRSRRAQFDRMNPAPTDRQASLGVSHAIGTGANATLDVVFRDRVGSASATQPVDRDSRSWRAGVNRAWRNLSLVYSMERGVARDAHADQRFETSAQTLSGTLRVGRSQTYGVYWMRDDNSNLDERDPRRVSSGLTASYAGGGGLSLNLNAQRTQSHFGRSDMYDLALIRQAERGARFTLSARRLEGRFARTDFMLSYSVPFAMPVMRRSDVATLRGRVFDAETSGGLKNVVLRLDGAVVATNANGEFEFPAVSAGAHQIQVEHGTMDVNQVPASAAPLAVTVTGRDSPPVMIAMVRSVVISVLVTLHPDGGESARGAAGVLVSFFNGETVHRRLTDANGRARLGGIAPGTWAVSLADDTLPAGFRPASGGIQVDPAPGESVTAEIPLTPERRAMRMLAPLAVR